MVFKMRISKEYLESILNNNFLVEHIKKYKEACDKGEKHAFEFLDENPDFMQVMMNVADSDEIICEEMDEI